MPTCRLGAEMLSLSAMVVSGDWWNGALAGKLLIALFAPLTSLALYAAGCRFATQAAGIVAAIVYLTTPWVLSVSCNGLVEGAFAFYLFAALYAVLLWNQQTRKTDSASSPGWAGISLLILAGLMAGGAAATKYPAVLYVIVPLSALIAAVAFTRSRQFRPNGRAGRVRALGSAGLPAGCDGWLRALVRQERRADGQPRLSFALSDVWRRNAHRRRRRAVATGASAAELPAGRFCRANCGCPDRQRLAQPTLDSTGRVGLGRARRASVGAVIGRLPGVRVPGLVAADTSDRSVPGSGVAPGGTVGRHRRHLERHASLAAHAAGIVRRGVDLQLAATLRRDSGRQPLSA